MTQENGRWQSLHVFYSSNCNPVLTDCVAPLIADLRGSGLLAGHFFLRYWMEGPHVRLRLRPSTPAAADEVRRRAEAAVDAFLDDRPSLYRLDPSLVDAFYKDMFLLEYSEREWQDRYGDGGMPLRDTNSFAWFPYEPEYDKYGGPDGVALAEWHFAASSDLVLSLLGRANLHVRTVMFGLAAQLMVTTSTAFLGGSRAVVEFMDHYRSAWERNLLTPDPLRHEGFDRNYDTMADDLRRRVCGIHEAVAADAPHLLGTVLRDWLAHGVELRERVVALATAGRLVFPVERGSSVRAPLTDPDAALRMLLFPYLHMTNNRLGVGLGDEVYLSYLLNRAIAEGSAVTS